MGEGIAQLDFCYYIIIAPLNKSSFISPSVELILCLIYLMKLTGSKSLRLTEVMLAEILSFIKILKIMHII